MSQPPYPYGQQPPYPGQQPPYPGQQPPYPGQQHPGQQPPYPGQQPPYPGQQPPYPGQQPPFSGQGYPPQQPGYPPQQPGYPPQQPGQFQPYPGQPGQFPPQGYPPQPYQAIQDPYIAGPPKPIQVEVQAWGLYQGFPCQLTVMSNLPSETIAHTACKITGASFLSVAGLKIKPRDSKKNIQKAEMILAATPVGQVVHEHLKPGAKLTVHLDLMPTLAQQLTAGPKLALFDCADLNVITQRGKDIAEQVVAFLNTEGGTVLIGAGGDYRIKGTRIGAMNSKQLHETIKAILKQHIHPEYFDRRYKTKVQPVMDAKGVKTDLSGIVLEVDKWQQPEELYSNDYIVYKRVGARNEKVQPQEVQNFTRQRKGKQVKVFQIKFG